MSEKKISFIVQARVGSTRLPNKILKPFYNGKSIVELIIEKLQNIKGIELIVATSDNESNIPLIKLLKEKGVKYYAGSENDVLGRFIEASEKWDIDGIIRVCADNPLLDVDAIVEIINNARSSDFDYISFNVNGTPSIKTHFGLWVEYVSLNALKRVNLMTQDPVFHEHVTNYIYTNDKFFSIKWLDIPSCISKRDDIRLTIDTQEDFVNVQSIYSKAVEYKSIEQLISCIDGNKQYLDSMRNQIILNSK